MESLSLQEAHRLIIDNAKPGEALPVPLDQGLGRIPTTPLKAHIPVPHFNRSLMDGYAVRSDDLDFTDPKKEVQLNIVGEIPAGRTDIPHFKKGQAIHIMTGGAMPQNADQVIPRENCKIAGSTLTISQKKEPKSWIQQQGSIIHRNQTITKAGEPISVEHLAMLAKAGVSTMDVFKPARVAILSTGSELVLPGSTPKPGQVVSANSLQLAGLLQKLNCILEHSAMADDKSADIIAILDQQLASSPDVIITTGGMGPGKYDLIPSAFKEIGINILYRSLKVNPGKNTMLGMRGSTLVFALPGPPPAARLLFHELVRPALRKIMGAARPLPTKLKATLLEPVHIRRPGFQSLLSGKTTNKNGQITIRRTRRHETSNAIILIPAHRRQVKAGEMISYHATNFP